MGGTQGKIRGSRGDAPELYERLSHFQNPRPRRLHNFQHGDHNSIKSSLRSQSPEFEKLIDTTISEPTFTKSSHTRRNTETVQRKPQSYTLQHKQQKQQQLQRNKLTHQIPAKVVTKNIEIPAEQTEIPPALPPPELPAPKIRLQILSPVHSRHRERMESSMEIPCTSLSDLKPGTDTKPRGLEHSNLLFLKKPPSPLHSPSESDENEDNLSKPLQKIPAVPISYRLVPPGKPNPVDPDCPLKRKLKVKGLRQFIDSHRRTCPPLWAKQFPCRSKFHPDNYLYDFEGHSAPKRPTAAMGKCPKKCGRCDRCGVYVDSVCKKCNRCSHDCHCAQNKGPSSIGGPGISFGGGPSLPSNPGGGGVSFAPTAEHFVSQLFGPNWSQSQKISVNDVPVEPDRPKLNLHECSSNFPLKIKNSKPVLATGYDSYSPVPEVQQQSTGYPYGGWYPSYPYSMPYYPPPYIPVPPPAPFYGYSPPPPPPNSNYSGYQVAVTK